MKTKATAKTTTTANGTWGTAYDRKGKERRVFIPNK